MTAGPNELSLREKLSRIQVELKAPKSKFNSFGKYNYRSAEDILEGLKPYNAKYGVYFTISENFIQADPVPIISCLASIHDVDSDDSISVPALVGVDMQQKGMQVPQAFGAASSYGKKYALGNLLLIDDTADADAMNTHGLQPKKAVAEIKSDSDPRFKKALEFVSSGKGSVDDIKAKYKLSVNIEKKLRAVAK